MADRVIQIVLRCELCNKPFDKQSTFKRHGYYCRSRKDPYKSVRLHSCVACAKAKARCDNKLPNCTRCGSKNVACQSQTSTTARNQISGNIDREPPRTGRPVNPELSTAAVVGDSESLAKINQFIAESETLDLDLGTFDDGTFNWNTIGLGVSGFQHGDVALPQSTPLESTDLVLISHVDTINGGDIGKIIPLTPPYIPAMPIFTLRSFEQRPIINNGGQMTATMLIRILTSYPTMMQKPNSLPPFIHPHFLTNIYNPEAKSLESLNTCVSLMQIARTNAQGGRKLLWRNVRLECEKLQQEWEGLDRWELLSSMQALLIYILIRLQDGETVYNNFDILLLSTVTTVASALNEQIGYILCENPSDLSTGLGWKDWVFEESRRRTINLIFSMAPAKNCNLPDGFLLAPLPARKQLWEAPTEELWVREKSGDPSMLKVFGVMVNGQMVKLSEFQALQKGEMIRLGSGECTDSSENWKEWCSGMDALGALVMLVTSSPDQYLI
ncbi:hypothetical protein B0J11DRAFT_512049 [Dendryphion nanum]|uniref:Zn(2)-C6 fungal-type domain-containing protein n=1 Tax=Dendryphion nanum TaxID=256645 RepID=A0A9P9D332_9PLEO|nr:hypothetical protein B0J11DRAFT_512049 [Dendryphion nanum]